mmetsp:Transcript_1851/g.4314  ORF Transcript_1851/g.4314 Transcript_1851/m.4314 type:complete len:205 (+) Transcript_1851:140-754(+)
MRLRKNQMLRDDPPFIECTSLRYLLATQLLPWSLAHAHVLRHSHHGRHVWHLSTRWHAAWHAASAAHGLHHLLHLLHVGHCTSSHPGHSASAHGLHHLLHAGHSTTHTGHSAHSWHASHSWHSAHTGHASTTAPGHGLHLSLDLFASSHAFEQFGIHLVQSLVDKVGVTSHLRGHGLLLGLCLLAHHARLAHLADHSLELLVYL